jgi:hypothetical protein
MGEVLINILPTWCYDGIFSQSSFDVSLMLLWSFNYMLCSKFSPSHLSRWTKAKALHAHIALQDSVFLGDGPIKMKGKKKNTSL